MNKIAVKNFREQNGCHNCLNARDSGDYENSGFSICFLQYPELPERRMFEVLHDFDMVPDYGICDEWQHG